MIEFTFQVAMRMSHNLPGGYDNGPPRPREARSGPAPGCRDAQTSADAPGVSLKCSAPPSAPTWLS